MTQQAHMAEETKLGDLAAEEMTQSDSRAAGEAARSLRSRSDGFLAPHGRPSLPIIHVISDSVGATAQTLARAAAAQFGETNPVIETLPKVRSFDEVRRFLEERADLHEKKFGSRRILVLYTIVDREMSRRLSEFVDQSGDIVAVDLLTHAIDAISEVSGRVPQSRPGSLHIADQHYFERIEAVEFAIAHDDGRNPQDLTKADIVIVGVSRTSKTPLSIYLSQQGYKVANVPLDLHTEPPKQLFEVDRTRLFGLMTTADVLVGIRRRRLGSANAVAASYADPAYVYEDLERARSLMRRLGCIVVRTDNRAVEETAQEILRFYEHCHPPLA